MVNLLENSEGCMTIGRLIGIIGGNGCHCGNTAGNLNLFELLFEYCSHCGCSFAEMSTIGHAAFAVCKVRQNNEKMVIKMQSIELEKDKFYDEQHNMEPNPMKYNSKMMNSIWGMYNRYSVHNFKKNIDDKVGGFAANQQSQSVGPAASGVGVERSPGDQKTAKSPQLLPSFWAPYDYSF
ncbi:hypothetical protein QE152_g25405 [Popillia japonica]|uniref:Uncharacterized protein n=1 Tax=Popillia japonica TaxID=7064 RepID=A0AAW1K266_POPJA